jgi:peptide deformylase
VMDSAQIFNNMDEKEKQEDHFPDAPGIKQVFINAHIVEELGDDWAYNEGCLSIPKIREDIFRAEEVTLSYMDVTGRIILHEYDHLDGKLFIDHISPLKRKLLKRKLDDISKGKIKVDYKMSFLK